MLSFILSRRSLRASLYLTVSCLFLTIGSGLFGVFAHANSSKHEPALVWTADDARLTWGPCPPFMPTGCGIAVLHGDPTQHNVDVFLRVPAHSHLPMHWHTSAERMVLVAGELHVTYEGQSTSVLKPGTYAFGPAKKQHDGRCVSSVPCVLFIAFESPLDAVAGGAPK